MAVLDSMVPAESVSLGAEPVDCQTIFRWARVIDRWARVIDAFDVAAEKPILNHRSRTKVEEAGTAMCFTARGSGDSHVPYDQEISMDVLDSSIRWSRGTPGRKRAEEGKGERGQPSN